MTIENNPFPPKHLTREKLYACERTISALAFYFICGDALVSKKPLSVVRMGDGEHHLFNQAIGSSSTDIVEPITGHDETWLAKLGINGIGKRELLRRIMLAANTCSHFAPSLSGIHLESFDLYKMSNVVSQARFFVDNFFVNTWTEAMKIDLFKAAGHVLFIHGNARTADSMQLRAQGNFGVKVSFLRLSHWSETELVIDRAHEIDAPLVLFSGGPAGKYIGPVISVEGGINKVVLDIGNAADRWTLDSLPIDRKAAELFHKEWTSRARAK